LDFSKIALHAALSIGVARLAQLPASPSCDIREYFGKTAMKLPHRRKFLHLAAGVAALPTASRITWADTYPSRPVHLLVGYAAGGTIDIVARLIGQWLSKRLGQSFVIENRPGAATNIATETVIRSPPDGYTLLVAGLSTNMINQSLYTNLNFDFTRDIAMVAGVGASPLVLEVNPSLPVNSVPELIAYAKANPNKISLASFGSGTISHVAGELFKRTAGVEMVHVHYRGSAPMLTDLIGGQILAAMDALPASIEYIKTGKVRVLAVTTAARSPALPDIPTLGDFFPDFEATSWIAIGAPKSTPREIIDKLNREIDAGLADPEFTARLVDLGATAFRASPANLDKLVVEQTEKWATVIRAANIKPE
jgi:tripartite-type tricarboxylate transporter receptor subunit TctC